MWACSWYVGSNVATVRPGPAYVSSSVCSTSFDRWRRTPGPGRRRAMRRSPPRSSWPTGRDSGATRPAQLGGERVAPARRRRERRLVGVEPDAHVDLRRVVALERPQVVADRHRDHGEARWRRYWRGCDRWPRWRQHSRDTTGAELSAAAEPSASYQRRIGRPRRTAPRHPSARTSSPRSTRPSGRCATPSACSSGPSSSLGLSRPSVT